MLNEYLYYNVFKVLRSSVENVVSVGRQSLDGNEIVQLYALSLRIPKLIEFTTDGATVCNVIFRVDNINHESLNEFDCRVYDLVIDNTSANAYVKKYVEEMNILLERLLKYDSDEARRYFTIMYSNRDITGPDIKSKVLEAINFYTEGFITSASKLLYDFFDIVRKEGCIGSGVSHTAAALHILRKSKPFLRVYNNMQPIYSMSILNEESKVWDELRALLKEATNRSDDCVISLYDELSDLNNNYGVLACSNSNSRYSIVIRNADKGLAYLVSVGWPEDI